MKTRLIAVYGSLLEGLSNHRVISSNGKKGRDYKKLGSGWTTDKYAMYSLGAYPFVTRQEAVSQIIVEVYEVSEHIANCVDHLEGCNPANPSGTANYYSRHQQSVLLDSGELVQPWMYFIDGRLANAHSLIAHGDWRHYLLSGDYTQCKLTNQE